MGMWSLRILNLVLGPAEGGLCDSPGKWRQMTIWHCSLQVLETSLLPHLQTLSSLSKACPVPCSLSIPIPVFLLFFNLSLEKSFWEQQGEGCGLTLLEREAAEWGFKVGRATLPLGGSRSNRRDPWRCPKGFYVEPGERTSQDDNQIIFENEMRRGGSEQKPVKRKRSWKSQKLVLCILRTSWLLAGFEISVDNSFTVGPQKNQWNWDWGRIHLSSWGEIEGVILKRQIIPNACN